LLETSTSPGQCADACDADETCVAFDYDSDGYCNAYKSDPLADYIGSGDSDWSCYRKIEIPASCDSSYVTEAVQMQIQIGSLLASESSLESQLDTCMSDKSSLES
jgi:hypothetical protein